MHKLARVFRNKKTVTNITVDNRNKSIILPRVSAKYAIKAGNFTEGIHAVEQAQVMLMTKKKILR
jgi:hypothetical protein